MLIFLGIAFSLYGTMHAYALGKVWSTVPHSPWAGWMLLIAGIAMTLAPFLLWLLSRYNWHATSAVASWVIYLWMGFLFLFCCTALLFDCGHLLFTIAGFGRTFNPATTLLATTLISLAFSGYGFYSARQIQVEEVKITTPKLASGKVTIAQISDLHLGSMLGEEFLQSVIARLHDLKPDIIAATGDILDGQGDDLGVLAKRLRTLQPPRGLFAVTGNHEYFAGLEPALRFLHDAGFTVLRGEAVKAGGIVLAGEDDPTASAMGLDVRTDTRQALASVGRNDFIVLLKHQPVVDTRTPFDLQLSGHVHGGQIFPFGLLTQLVYRVHTGLTSLGNGRWLYVSRGTGTWGPPIRVFAAPEITLITIESFNNRQISTLPD